MRDRVLSLNKLGTVIPAHYLLLAASNNRAKQAQKGPSRARGSESPPRVRFQRVEEVLEAEKGCVRNVHLAGPLISLRQYATLWIPLPTFKLNSGP
jgi:hypothetical protein